MQNVNFGLALQYDTGAHPSLAAGPGGLLVEVHSSGNMQTLWYHVGTPKDATVEWSGGREYDSGQYPAVAANNKGQLVEVHKSQTFDKLWYHVGTLNHEEKRIAWSQSCQYDSGTKPHVALNDHGVVVEVHESGDLRTLWYHVGTLSENKIKFGGSVKYDNGLSPRVALNTSGVVVEVHRSEGYNTLWCRVGQVNSTKIDWGSSVQFASGKIASVALGEDGTVLVVFSDGGKLYSRVGGINGKTVQWLAEKSYFDDGDLPAVTCRDGFVAQVHTSETDKMRLFYSTSFFADRARWMQDHASLLQKRSLRDIILPASHDSAMYQHGTFQTLGKTQDLSIYEQLSYGIRYFDLRPGWDGDDFFIYHGPIKGPKLSTVLDDTRRYMQEGYKELILLKFSHYNDFTAARYSKMADCLIDKLRQWLFTPATSTKRLSDRPLSDFTANGGRILVLCDAAYPADDIRPGIWIYKDGYSGEDSNRNILSVYDKYSNTTDYEKMKKDQLDQYAKFSSNGNPKYDLFLLSWTLTPPTAVWLSARTANRLLGTEMASLTMPNRQGAYPNL
ncbi:hypothetical protein LJC71_11625, partial [Desulfosarcina sp. OttesenSCG-928-A07]|nr:hypothetical protein [Desulfosarcina sp. OttesenSCG-928-A07]